MGTSNRRDRSGLRPPGNSSLRIHSLYLMEALDALLLVRVVTGDEGEGRLVGVVIDGLVRQVGGDKQELAG